MANKVDTDVVISWVLALVFIVIWAMEELAGTPAAWLRLMPIAMIVLAIEKKMRWRRTKT